MSGSQVAIVTGGAQGIGAEICKALLKEGYKICIADIQEQKGRDFTKELNESYGSESVIFSFCDVSNETDYKNTFEFMLKEFKRVDVLVNNAGILLEQDVKRMIDVNLMGPIYGCQTGLKYMSKVHGGNGGVIINTASLVGFMPNPAMPAYTASKHGIIGLTRSYGAPLHLTKHGVMFMALCPSFTDTAIVKLSDTHSLVPNLFNGKFPDMMSPDYVAQGVIKLLEDRINGSALYVSFEGYQYVDVQSEFKDISLE